MRVLMITEEYKLGEKTIKNYCWAVIKKIVCVTARRNKNFIVFIFNFLLLFILLYGSFNVYSQTTYQPNYSTQNQSYGNYFANSSAFRQEIARMEIYVLRQGEEPLPITEVPRLEKNDVLKVRLLNDSVNGIKLDQSNYDWTFMVAFLNPGRNSDPENTVSEEIQLKKTGWYKEYLFAVPYDSQAVFFLYPKPNYRAKILNLVSKNQNEIRKLGEKTIEIAGAYAKISSFLNELQAVVYRNQYNNGYGYGNYGSSYGYYQNNYNNPKNYFMEQAVERLARSFNIQLPPCWTDFYGSGYNTYNNSYNNNNNYNNNYYNNYNAFGPGNDFTGRVQCVARSIRLEDLDMSISQMLQQGGIFAAAELTRKYPQIAFWINIAAVALDFILKFTKKTPLRIVPTVFSVNQNQWQNYDSQTNSYSYQNSFVPTNHSNSFIKSTNSEPVKISLFSDLPPNDNGFVTAYPLVIHNWQANPDPKIIRLPTPALVEPCLHVGQNTLRSTDLINDWVSDPFTREFKLVITSRSGFRKEFPLQKNIGLGGWDLFLTKEDLESYPDINLNLESEIVGKRGFKTIKSPKFELLPPVTGAWLINPESQKKFAVGGKRVIILRNQGGNCRCLQVVIYKPSFGGEFVFEPNNQENPLKFSADHKEALFVVDATNFQPGKGKLEIRQFGSEVISLSLDLHPASTNNAVQKSAPENKKAETSKEETRQSEGVKPANLIVENIERKKND